MKITKPLKITGIVILSLAVLAIIVNVGINILIKKQLPAIIDEQNDTAYDLTYEDMNFSIFQNSLSVHQIKLMPKENSDIKKDIDFFGTIERVSVSGVNFYELIKNKNLKAFTISVIRPDITVLKTTEKDTLSSESQWTSNIDIDKIRIQNAGVRMMNTAGDSLLHEVFNFNAEIDGVHMGTYTVDKNIPFTYTDYTFKIDSVYSLINDFQIAKSDEINIDQKNITIDRFQLLPYVSSEEFKENKTDSNTRLLVEVPKLSLKNTDWGYNMSDDLFVRIGTIAIDSVNVKILDQKNKTVVQNIEEDMEKTVQPLIPFQLKVDELNIKKSAFNSLGNFDVQNVNIQMKNISNDVNERLLVEELQLNNPKFTHIPKKASKKSNNSNNNKLNDVIEIRKLQINDAEYSLKNKSGKQNQLKVNDFNLTLSDIRVDEHTIMENVPFTYKNPVLSSGKIHFDAGKHYTIYSNGITLNEEKAVVKEVKVSPKISRKQHASQLKYAEDYYDVSVSSLELKNYNWGFDRQNEFFVRFKEVVLNQMNASIYRDVSIPRKPEENHLYSYRLRHISFPFEVESLKIKNSRLSYEEDTKSTTQPGKLTFSEFNLTANHLYSGYKKSRGPKTDILVKTKFMQQGDLIVSWQFDIMNTTEQFNINGNLKNFPATAMNPFLKPYINVNAEGKIDKMEFNFSGNNDTATGEYAMNFENLRMKLFNKENKERKFLTAAANTFVRNDTDGLKKVEIKPVDRQKDASFFNYLWQCIMQGLKQTVL